MLSAEGEANFLVHHAGSVSTEMSVKALGEFDFELMESVVSKLE